METILLCGVLVAGLVVFGVVMNDHYRISTWLFWRYLRVAAVAAWWTAGCASMGLFLLDRLGAAGRGGSAAGPRTRDDRSDVWRDELPLAFALGVLAFQLAIFLVGLAGALNAVTFVLIPTAFLLAGGHRFLTVARAVARGIGPPRSVREAAIVLFGAGGIALLYFQLLSPENFSWDSRWYHLGLAEQYAREGAVRRFPEGWWLSSYPHSASLTYAWAFLMPSTILWDKLELCAHLEMAVFLCTLASIPALMRQLIPDTRGRLTWVAMFLFPGIFLYDSNLHAGADHMAALFCIPLVLALIRVWRSWTPRNALLFGALYGGTMLTKYSAWSMLIFPALLFIARAAWLGVAWVRGRGRVDRGEGAGPASAAPPRGIALTFLAGGAAILLVSAPFWLKNLVYYGDPLYPVLWRHLSVHPWSAESPEQFRIFKSFTSPPRPGMDGVIDGLKAIFTFSFIPNDWPDYHRDVPVLGSLFTVAMFCLPLVRAGKRVWLAFAGCVVALFTWYMSNHQDRMLQAFMPVMATATLAVLILAWRRRQILVRAAVVALVGLQIVWGGDVPFIPAHNLIRDTPFRQVVSFLASGYTNTPNRLRPYGAEADIASALPRDARVLLHEIQMHVGINARVVNDQWQGRISYLTWQSPAAIYRELLPFKVTHLLWNTAEVSDWNSVGADLAFLGFARNYAQGAATYGDMTLAAFPSTPPPEGPFNDRVVVLACGSPYANGVYRLRNLRVPAEGQPWATPEGPADDVAAAISGAGFLAVQPDCAPALPPEIGARFHAPIRRNPYNLYVRKLGS